MRRFLSVLMIAVLGMALLPALAFGAAPQYEDLTGYEFVPGSVYTITDTVDWTHDHYNYGSLPDTVTYTVRRVRSASCTTSVSVSVNGLVSMIGDAEVKVGTSDEVYWSATFSIPAMTWGELSSGSHRKKPTGTERYWWHGELKSSTSVSGKFTKGSYTKKVEHPL
ncbi:MAG: hypothetical protein K6T75_07065 [Acetobacteraceae bacterium]|nr:hypothetical protein [Acetobacteraceae bacterium]